MERPSAINKLILLSSWTDFKNTIFF